MDTIIAHTDEYLDILLSQRMDKVRQELCSLNQEMQKLLDVYGATVRGQEMIRILKLKHDKLLRELISLQNSESF